MKPAPSSAFHDRRNERGVALIIVLGFLGLMVMMAVAFMVQARVERMVADSTLDGMRARQFAQTGIAAAVQDYLNEYMEAVKDKTDPSRRSDSKFTMFLSGARKTKFVSNLLYGNSDLWEGESYDWLPSFITSDRTIDIDNVDKMKWIWIRQDPEDNSSRILGRYAYVCFNLSGGVDANLLGRDFGDEPPSNGYGAQTNRNNVRKMVLASIQDSPSTDRNLQFKLARYQRMWQGFDTPAALDKLTDGKPNVGSENSSDKDRWATYDMDESTVKGDANAAGLTKENKKYLSCYSYAATHKTRDMQPFTPDSIQTGAQRLTELMGGNWEQVRQSLEDYLSNSPTPKGTHYPSVKAVPMFNEIKAEAQLVQAPGTGKTQLQITITPEFWGPFPSQDTPSGSYYLDAPEIGGGSSPSGDKDIWVHVRVTLEGGQGTAEATLQQVSVTPSRLSFPFSSSSEMVKKPHAPDKFVYLLDIGGIDNPDGPAPVIKQLGIYSLSLMKELTLKVEGGGAVDTTPSDQFTLMRTVALKPGGEAQARSREVKDPRLNHLEDMWDPARPQDSINDENTCLQEARNQAWNEMGYEPGKYMYCRNDMMVSPAELGYIPIYTGTPWMTLDIFSDDGIDDVMNNFIGDDGAWEIMNDKKYDVYYTNGTINPYTRNVPVLAGAFRGIDAREVPNMEGEPKGNSDLIGEGRADDIAKELVKDTTPEGKAFDKAGPAGWTRALRNKGFEFNKNERVALAHNTWGLFNESDTLVLAFVVAQSITEAPGKVNPVGSWNEKEDMITGERWAVALCWMDSSKNGPTDSADREMDIIMFKYLNE